MFFCNICKKTFELLSTLGYHIRKNHLSLSCNLCEKALRSVPDLNLHHHRAHNQLDHICLEAASSTQCGSISENNEDISNHVDQQHKSSIYTNPPSTIYSRALCDDTFSTHDVLDIHLEYDHSILGSASCEICHNILLNKAELERHTIVEHNTSTTYCSPFGKTYPSRGALEDHVQPVHTHPTPSSPCICYKCDEVLPNHHSHNHVQTCHSSVSWHSCNTCGILYETLNELSMHVK